MAELILKVGDNLNSGYMDGDIIEAFNQRRIRCTHAQHICHIKNTAFNSDGLNSDGIARKFQEFIYKYKFERISRTEIKKILLSDMSEELFDNTPNAKGERINVPLFIQRRLEHSRHRIFGTVGNEFWYGGNIDMSNTVMDLVWTMIETDTVEREINHTLFPLGTDDKKDCLALGIDDFSEVEVRQYREVEYKIVGDIDVMVKKRKRRVDWRVMTLPVSRTDIEDRTLSIDIRNQVTLNKVTDIITKPLGVEVIN